jgi:hypothetical protein
VIDNDRMILRQKAMVMSSKAPESSHSDSAIALALSKTETLGFVLIPYDFECALPFSFGPNCVLERANAEVTEMIRSQLKSLSDPRRPARDNSYEQRLVRTGTDSANVVELRPEDWRYYVVNSADGNESINHLHLVSNITARPLENRAMTFQIENGACRSWGYQAHIISTHLAQADVGRIEMVNEAHLIEIRETAANATLLFGHEAIPKSYPELYRALNMFEALKQLPTSSEFVLLGLFAIIEMLITHNPKLEDRGDSITHQMQSKIPLLSHRFDRPLDYAKYFGQASEKKVWTALYGLRSSIAHGGEGALVWDLPLPEIPVLYTRQRATFFVREVVKSLLRHSLKEPELYRDIRQC